MSVWFVIPAHGRVELGRVCFNAIRWACDELASLGVEADAIVVAADGNLDAASDAGLRTIKRPNAPLGRKWNDAFEFACRSGADYVMPCGSDDWLDPILVATMLERHLALGANRAANTMVCCRLSSAVSADGREIAHLRIPYDGGDGVRLIPLAMLNRVAHRPAADGRDRAIDGSIFDRLRTHGPVAFEYVDRHPLQIVDFKSETPQLTGYEKLADAYATSRHKDPWSQLELVYPSALVESMSELHGMVLA